MPPFVPTPAELFALDSLLFHCPRSQRKVIILTTLRWLGGIHFFTHVMLVYPHLSTAARLHVLVSLSFILLISLSLNDNETVVSFIHLIPSVVMVK